MGAWHGRSDWNEDSKWGRSRHGMGRLSGPSGGAVAVYEVYCTVEFYACECPRPCDVRTADCRQPRLRGGGGEGNLKSVGRADNEIEMAKIVHEHCKRYPGHGRFILAQELAEGRYLTRTPEDRDLVEMLEAAG